MEEIDNKAEKRKDADIMKKYKAVFSDIDGTLLNSKHQIPENTRKKIKQINQNGIPYVLVSARMPKGMTAIRAELEAKSPMICYSGALVVDEEDHPIYSVAMPQEVAMKLCRRVYELNPKISVNIYTNDEWLVKDKKEYCLSILEQLGLSKDECKRDIRQLSGGQQQRLCIARSLAANPKILLMDEPTSALDPISTSKIEELIDELKKDYTIIIVTHNMQQATRAADKTAFFLLGELVEFDDTEKIFNKPNDKRTENYITGRFG